MTETNPTQFPESSIWEGRVLARHLVGEGFPEFIPARYADCLRKKCGEDLSLTPDPLTSLALAHPSWIGPLDTFLGLVDRKHDLRKRLLIMSALMESTPEYADKFLADKVTFTQLAILALKLGPGIALRGIFGAILYSYYTLSSRG